MAENGVRVNEQDLRGYIIKKLTGAGLDGEQAGVVAEVLVYAELRGVASHGVMRVEHYVNRIRAGGINLKATFAIDWVKPSVGRLDAQGGMGHVATAHAARAAIKAAAEHGIAMTGVLNNSHNGALAYYADMALREKKAALVCSDTDRLVVPIGGKHSFLGSNPLAFAFPGRRENVLIDMATSEIAWGKIINARLAGQPLAPNWAVDAEGNPATDPHKAVALTPFGGPKGYSINIMIEALTGLLIGGVFGPHLKKMYEGLDSYRNLCTCIIVIDPSVFWGGDDVFLDTAQRMIDELHAQPAADPNRPVMVPGEIERRAMENNRRDGIPVPRAIYDYLVQ